VVGFGIPECYLVQHVVRFSGRGPIKYPHEYKCAH